MLSQKSECTKQKCKEGMDGFNIFLPKIVTSINIRAVKIRPRKYRKGGHGCLLALVSGLAEAKVLFTAIRSHFQDLGTYALRNPNAYSVFNVAVDPIRCLSVKIVTHDLVRHIPIVITLPEILFEENQKVIQTLL